MPTSIHYFTIRNSTEQYFIMKQIIFTKLSTYVVIRLINKTIKSLFEKRLILLPNICFFYIHVYKLHLFAK